MRLVPSFFYRQSGIIPFRFVGADLEILLITSRRKGRWIIPKGVVEPLMSPSRSAEKEALEEAGILGRVYPEPIGSYSYEKWGDTCTVSIFLMEVERELDEWDESDVRRREWMSIEQGASSVQEPALRKLLRRLPELVRRLRGGG